MSLKPIPAEVPEFTQDRGRPLWGAVGLSLGVHLLVLYFLYSWTLSTSPASRPEPRQSLAVTLSRRVEPVQQTTAVVREVQGNSSGIPAPRTESGIESSRESGVQNREENAPANPQFTAADNPQALPSAPVPAQQDEEQMQADNSTGRTGSVVQQLDAGGIQTALQGFRSSYRSELIGEWSEECLLYQRRHPGEKCPQQETVSAGLELARETTGEMMREVLRGDREAGRRRELRGESEETFLALQESGGLQRELLQHRYAMLRERYDYMNGNYNNAAMNFVKASQAGNPNLGILVFNMMQFICDPSPCKYDETEFTVERPPEPEGLVPAFELDSSLFEGGR